MLMTFRIYGWCRWFASVTKTFGVVVARQWISSPSCNTSAWPVYSTTEQVVFTFYSMAYFDNDLKELFEMFKKSSQSTYRGVCQKVIVKSVENFSGLSWCIQGFWSVFYTMQDHNICIHFTKKKILAIQQGMQYVLLRLFVVFELPISNSLVFSLITHLLSGISLHSQHINPKAEMIKVGKKVVVNINFIIHKRSV